MKVKLNQPAYYKGEHYKEGDTLTVGSRLGGAWIQTGRADEVSSKKTVRTSKRKPSDSSGGEDTSTGSDSNADD